MKIHVVTVSSGWILEIVARGIAGSHPDFSVSYEPRRDVDANFYVDVQNCFFDPTPVMDVGLFTHLDLDSIGELPDRCLRVDYLFHFTSRYMSRFIQYGVYPKDKMSVMVPFEPQPGWKPRNLVLGVFQRGGPPGKGTDFMREMIPRFEGFDFVLVGSGWDSVAEDMTAAGIKVEVIADEQFHTYRDIYNRVDFTFIPSLWEGGPMGLLESKTMGVPVIASDVGWVGHEFEAEHVFKTGDAIDCSRVLDLVQADRKARAELAGAFSYRRCADQVVEVVKSR